MTRENKLALVVGFGLILVVAILISDHFSTVRSQEAAPLLPPDDPLTASRDSGERIIDFRPEQPRAAGFAGPAGVSRPAATNVGRITTPPPEVFNMPDLQRPAPAAPPATADAGPLRADDPLQTRFHEVARGDNLSAICTRYYGSEALVRPLARFNGLSDPDEIRAGHRLRIPPAAELGGTPPRPTAGSGSPARPASTATTTYTIRPGDVLSTLARTTLGSATRWRELYELNRDVIDDPDRLLPGTVLRIPSRSR